MNKKIRILGLMTTLSYLMCILYTWILAELNGFVYFSAGEPNPYIRYPELGLGLLAIGVVILVLKRELDEEPQVIYDPLV